MPSVIFHWKDQFLPYTLTDKHTRLCIELSFFLHLPPSLSLSLSLSLALSLYVSLSLSLSLESSLPLSIHAPCLFAVPLDMWGVRLPMETITYTAQSKHWKK